MLLLSVALLTAAKGAGAQAIRVDDSQSQVLGSTLRLKWDQAAPRDGRAGTLSGSITVLVRLDVRAWRGRNARIYQTLPAQAGADVLAHWTSQGVLLPGQMRSGERALVYAGPITSDFLQDTFRLTIRANGDTLERAERLDFGFEIEPEAM
ncbi:hypothetical protein C6N40_00735 [Arenimonas caeni]|uniref:Uncharacterized protein n=2 Tax=Arenimonas caeni TaxID=2058085 RepID=A0A2P6MCH8_9GAMM|nr:hypothetical protein C6N40_00735 [Arenimonas caeni]